MSRRDAAAAGGGRRPRPLPDFCLPADSGEVVCLRDVLVEGPALIWFYRGYW